MTLESEIFVIFWTNDGDETHLYFTPDLLVTLLSKWGGGVGGTIAIWLKKHKKKIIK